MFLSSFQFSKKNGKTEDAKPTSFEPFFFQEKSEKTCSPFCVVLLCPLPPWMVLPLPLCVGWCCFLPLLLLARRFCPVSSFWVLLFFLGEATPPEGGEGRQHQFMEEEGSGTTQKEKGTAAPATGDGGRHHHQKKKEANQHHTAPLTWGEENFTALYFTMLNVFGKN